MTKEEMQYKIYYEIIVDCYEDHEVNMGWFYFFQDEVNYPFEAEIAVKNRAGKKKLVKVEVLDVSNEEGFDNGGIAFEVNLQEENITIDVDIAKLKNIKGNDTTQEAFEIWQYWKTGM